MAATAAMPGNWPSDNLLSYESLSTRSRLQVPEQSWLRTSTSGSESSSRSSVDDLFFDCPGPASTNSPSPSPNQDTRSPISTFSIFEPVVQSVSDADPIDWRRHKPPPELLYAEDETSDIIRDILQSSIERVQQRIVDEHERQAAAARPERGLARKKRASGKPKREILNTMSGGLGSPSQDIELSGMSVSSGSNRSSADSGYASTTSKSPRESRTAKRFSGISALFGRKTKPSVLVIDNSAGSLLEETQDRSSPIWTPDVDTEDDPALIPINVPEPATSECVSCLDDFETGVMVKLICHRYCTQCFIRLVSTALESETQWPVKCCLNTVPTETILPHLTTQLSSKYHLRESEWSVPASDRIYCSHTNCGAFIAREHLHASKNHARCPKCAKKTCTTCRGKWHRNLDCPNDPALQATMTLAEQEGWKRCFSCQAMVEHNRGCRHMTCRCKAQFCYICGLKWRTCACTEDQLVAVHAEVERRRALSGVESARVAAAREEERVVLQMVAEFEAAEAERVATAVEAQRLRDEEERRAAEAERERMQFERMETVDATFKQLSAELDLLHDLQKIEMNERYEAEAVTLNKDILTSVATLRSSHRIQIAGQSRESQHLISTSSARFQTECQTRMAEEQRIETAYLARLATNYIAAASTIECELRAARNELRHNQDNAYRVWDEYRQARMEDIRRGERVKMEQLEGRLAREVRGVEDQARIEAVVWRGSVRAEGRWWEEVRRERGVMVGELEGVEYAKLQL